MDDTSPKDLQAAREALADAHKALKDAIERYPVENQREKLNELFGVNKTEAESIASNLPELKIPDGLRREVIDLYNKMASIAESSPPDPERRWTHGLDPEGVQSLRQQITDAASRIIQNPEARSELAREAEVIGASGGGATLGVTTAGAAALSTGWIAALILAGLLVVGGVTYYWLHQRSVDYTSADSDEIVGTWLTEDNSSSVSIYRSGSSLILDWRPGRCTKTEFHTPLSKSNRGYHGTATWGPDDCYTDGPTTASVTLIPHGNTISATLSDQIGTYPGTFHRK